MLLGLFFAIHAVESEGPDYRIKLTGEKRFHFESRMAAHAPMGFAPGQDRTEALDLALDGDIKKQYRIEGRFENAGISDPEGILYLSCSGRDLKLLLGRFNGELPGMPLFGLKQRMEGGFASWTGRVTDAALMASRRTGTPIVERFSISGVPRIVLSQSPVLFQSEILEMDGETLVRGRDYLMDYGQGGVTFTPSYLADRSLQGNGSGTLRIAYETGGSASGLYAGSLGFRPLSWVNIRVAGMQETGNDTSGGLSTQRKGAGATLVLGKDSTARLTTDAGLQVEQGRKALAQSVSGHWDKSGLVQMDGRVTRMDAEYRLMGNTLEASTPNNGRLSGRFTPFKSMAFNGEYGVGRRSEDGSTREEEAFGRFDFEPWKRLGLSSWARTRKFNDVEKVDGTEFGHAEFFGHAGRLRWSTGTEYERQYGSEESSRIPWFIRAGADSLGPLACDIRTWVEPGRGGADGMVSLYSRPVEIQFNGTSSIQQQGLTAWSGEGRLQTGFSEKLKFKGSVREALETAVTSDSGVASKSRRSFYEGELFCRPLAIVRITYSPLRHVRKGLDDGRGLFSEARHRLNAEVSGKRVKLSAGAENNGRHVLALWEDHWSDKKAWAKTGVVLPRDFEFKATSDIQEGAGGGTSPETGEARFRSLLEYSAEARLLKPLGARHTVSGGTQFQRTFQTADGGPGGSDRDTSSYSRLSILPDRELQVCADRLDRRLSLEWLYGRETGDVVLRCALFHKQDFVDDSGSAVSGGGTSGVYPEIMTEWRISEPLSLSLSCNGEWQIGYRSGRNLTCAFSLDFDKKPFLIRCEAQWADRRNRFETGQTLILMADFALRM